MRIRPRWARRLLAGGVCAVACASGVRPAGATPVDIAIIKAAFLYNFAKFAEWPADVLPPGRGLSLCVLDERAVADALEQTIKGHAIEGHDLGVQVLAPNASTAGCHLLYISAAEARRSPQLIAGLRELPVLTVSDAAAFAESGGIIQLIVENDRMRFAINPAAADRAKVRLSAKLLSLARIVKEAR